MKLYLATIHKYNAVTYIKIMPAICNTKAGIRLLIPKNIRLIS